MLNNRFETRTPKFLDCLQEIEKSGHTLRKALLARNAEAIWEAITLQEESLNNLRLCHAATASDGEGNPDGAPRDPMAREMVKRTRSVLRTNRVLARTFLDIIDKTLASIANGGVGGTPAYNATGKVEPLSAPLLVQRRG